MTNQCNRWVINDWKFCGLSIANWSSAIINDQSTDYLLITHWLHIDVIDFINEILYSLQNHYLLQKIRYLLYGWFYLSQMRLEMKILRIAMLTMLTYNFSKSCHCCSCPPGTATTIQVGLSKIHVMEPFALTSSYCHFFGLECQSQMP